jgi:uncharacterized protein (TIGR03067 family)
MRTVIAACAATVLLTAAQADDKKPAGDAAKLEGKWAAVKYVEDGEEADAVAKPEYSKVRWVFKGDKVTLLAVVEGASLKGSFKLSQGAKHKTIDLEFPAPDGGKGKQASPGIYELDGDTLKVCYATGKAKRPEAFESKAGSVHVLAVFKRLK